ncbi:hypothetical protein LWI28_021667 [Acer negundo]|uniref:SAWADEE domain-containing protein n=1 Tax=Acer negundo TaxID=4023 RepID=A0AAD5IWJ3_ACENE|nr:hypothetical protein LWI28_021667 [Acer negundo]
MLTSVNSPSSLLQVVSNGVDDGEEEMKYRPCVDDAWYSVRVAFDGRAGKLIVRYCNFPDENVSVYEAGKFFTFQELATSQAGSVRCSYSFRQRVPQRRRRRTPRLRLPRLHRQQRPDAVVEQVNHKKHSFAVGEDEGWCPFMLVWQHGPNANSLTEKKIESICIVQSIRVQVPMLLVPIVVMLVSKV